jgi:ubiquitin C-terminal hydrolase
VDLKISELSLREGDYVNSGLPNIGSTCYLNSILQLLFAAKILRD